MRSLFSLGFLALFLTSLAFADAGKLNKDCKKETKPVPFSYCVFTTEGSKNPDVLYYFHGMGLDEKSWADKVYYPTQLRKRWAEKNFDSPTVVAISFGPVWLLAEKNKSENSGLYNLVVDGLIPTIEKSFPKAPKKRLLIGESMGGFNGTQLALKTNLFDRAALLCPPMVEISPFSSEAEVKAMIKSSGANEKLVRQTIMLAKAVMPEKEDWEKANPLTLVNTKVAKDSTKLYVSCGSHDEYGFYPGTEKFAALGQKAQPTLQWRPLYGGHCAVDVNSLADFISAD